MDPSYPAQRAPPQAAQYSVEQDLVFHQAGCPGAGAEEGALSACQAPRLHTASRRTTSHLPPGLREQWRGKEGEKEDAWERSLPATSSTLLCLQHKQSAKVPRWQGSLGARCALFARQDIPPQCRVRTWGGLIQTPHCHPAQ